MITGATHTLSVELIKSMQDFRSILDQRASTNIDKTSTLQGAIDATTPLAKAQEPTDAQKTTIDYEALNADIQSRKDNARKAAVHTAELQHKKNLVDIYMDASSNGDVSGSSDIEPADVYQTSLKYSRRIDLINAFESAAQNESNGSHISLLV